MNYKKITIYIIIILISIFLGYQISQNKRIIIGFYNKAFKLSERYYYFVLNKIGLSELEKKIDKNLVLTYENDSYTEIAGNSFSVFYSKVKSFPGRTASIFLSEKNDLVNYEIFTQEGFIIKNKEISEINFPSIFYSSTGVRSVFTVNNQYFVLAGFSDYTCKYATIFRLKDKKNILKSKCLPDNKKVDFDGLGGAYVKTDNEVLLTIGTPVHQSRKISNLAQDKESIFGKIISIKKETLIQSKDKIDFDIYSIGHRNPQGLVNYENEIFSFEHGPQGGDELNIIIKGKNYGWPITSFGTKYSDGESYQITFSDSSYKEPLFSFVPSVATSALNICPKNLLQYYYPYKCLMGLSLKDMSILILVLNKDNNVIIYEKINLGNRLRHFGLDYEGKLFVDNKNHFYISMDRDGLYKVKFDNIR